MNKLVPSLALLFLIITIAACRKKEDSSAVSQNRIFCQYQLSYDANTNKSIATANFTLDNATGKILILSSPSNVTFNNTNLAYNNTNKNYKAEFTGKVDSGSFVWTDTEQHAYTNKIYMTGYEIEFPNRVLNIYYNNLYEFFWQGYALDQYEKVEFTLSGFDSVSTQTFTENRINSQSIVLNLQNHAGKPTDTGKGDMIRSATFPLQEQTTAGGTKSLSYKAAQADVQIIQ